MLIAPSEQTAPVCRPGSTEPSSTCFGLLLVRKTLLNELQEQYVCLPLSCTVQSAWLMTSDALRYADYMIACTE